MIAKSVIHATGDTDQLEINPSLSYGVFSQNLIWIY